MSEKGHYRTTHSNVIPAQVGINSRRWHNAYFWMDSRLHGNDILDDFNLYMRMVGAKF